MALSKQELIRLYRRRARRYDFSAKLYYLIGFREYAYRKKAIGALALEPGDTVVELGCGTGLNFPYLHRAVGPEGRIIGVDLTDFMLDEAWARVREEGWSNVELVRSDAAAYDYPTKTSGILSTFALGLFPEYDDVIRKAASALQPEGRLVLLDFKKPDWAPLWLLRFMALITRPFGVTLDLAERHPWESVGRYFEKRIFQELYFGFAYLAVGEGPKSRSSSKSVERPKRSMRPGLPVGGTP